MKKIICIASAAIIAGATSVTPVAAHDHKKAKTAWSYSGETGPENWGKLDPAYAIAEIGKNQSPIDIAGPSIIEADLPPIVFNYKDETLKVINKGFTIEAEFSGQSSIQLDDTTFNLLQLHYHSPSENLIDGKSYPLEVHLVHADADGNLAVVGLLYEEGESDDQVDKIWAAIPDEVGVANEVEGLKFDPLAMLPEDRDYYRFNGSLTTPPATEGVRWLVLKETGEVSKEQIEAFEDIIGFPNNRPVQPTNARPILK